MSQTATLEKYTETDVENDRPRAKEPYSVGEHVVLLTIVGLSLINGMSTMMMLNTVLKLKGVGHSFFSRGIAIGPIPGAVLVPFLSEVYGRRPVFILLATLCTMSSIFLAVPDNVALIIIGFSIHAISKGGGQTMFCIAIAEYCTSKHRFAYFTASVTAWFVVGLSTPSILYAYVFKPDSVYLQVIMIVLGLACLGSTCVWPESPYWLAARGRRADAACSLRRLRGARAEPELSQLQHERRSPGPARLYWRPLLISLIAITLYVINELPAYTTYFSYVWNELRGLVKVSGVIENGAAVIVLFVIGVTSYFVKRKVLYFTCCAVPIALNFVTGLWMGVAVDTTRGLPFHIIVYVSYILCHCGPLLLSMIVSIEIIPYKYNTHISCVCTVYMMTLSLIGARFITAIDSIIYDYYFVFILLIATLSVVGLGLFVWLAPETKDRTLFEIQKSHSPQYTVTYPEQNETMMGDLNR